MSHGQAGSADASAIMSSTCRPQRRILQEFAEENLRWHGRSKSSGWGSERVVAWPSTLVSSRLMSCICC